MSGRLVYTLHLWPPLGHARHYTGSTFDRQLARRLTDHALGRGARLTQVQAERGGTWVLAQTEPGGRARERQLKNEGGASRRCQVCKAVSGYQAGNLTQEQALARAGWDRATEHDRGLLLDMLGIDPAHAPQPAAGHLPEAPAVREIPAPRPAPDVQYHITPEIEALVDQLERSWSRTAGPQPGTHPAPGPEPEPEPEPEPQA